MTRPRINAILQDGPRAGETVSLDVGHQDDPPKEFLLADEHLGARSADHRVDRPSGSVSTYRLVGRDGQAERLPLPTGAAGLSPRPCFRMPRRSSPRAPA